MKSIAGPAGPAWCALGLHGAHRAMHAAGVLRARTSVGSGNAAEQVRRWGGAANRALVQAFASVGSDAIKRSRSSSGEEEEEEQVGYWHGAVRVSALVPSDKADQVHKRSRSGASAGPRDRQLQRRSAAGMRSMSASGG